MPDVLATYELRLISSNSTYLEPYFNPILSDFHRLTEIQRMETETPSLSNNIVYYPRPGIENGGK